ncbi:hypothetical protein [Streptomyces sp. 1222.5]|uniref:hypothetical protein n=1 Tax=Streptomyces sp. 1222.5 TaxID=1881026 RepID=UPI003D728FDA
MSRRKNPKGRQRLAQRRSEPSQTGAIIEVTGLPGVHMTLEITDMTLDEVTEARRQAALCNVEHPLVKQMVYAFVQAFKLEPATGPEWSVGELATLLQALGLLPEWTSPVDVELAHLLESAAAGQAGGGS